MILLFIFVDRDLFFMLVLGVVEFGWGFFLVGGGNYWGIGLVLGILFYDFVVSKLFVFCWEF
jgi:hypothetical protein